MFNKVVVANRGAVAARVLRALDPMGIHRSPCIPKPTTARRICDGERNLRDRRLARPRKLSQPGTPARRVRGAGVDGLHPGYGFLSENAQFAERVQAGAHEFHRPFSEVDHAMGHKTRAREIAAKYGMPMSKGSAVLPVQPEAILAAAREIGYPVLAKPGRRWRHRHVAGERRR